MQAGRGKGPGEGSEALIRAAVRTEARVPGRLKVKLATRT